MLAALCLGQDWKQRLRLQRSMMSALGYALAIGVLVLADEQHWVMIRPAYALLWGLGLAPVFFLLLIRCGLNRIFKDPAMTMPQLMVAVSFAAWIYSLGGYLRDAILLVVCPLLAWGFHFLRARQIRLVSLYALASLGSAMVYLMLWRAGQYDMGGELLRFMLLALVIFLIWQSTQDRGDDEDSWLERLLTLVLTGDPKQRLRLQRFLVAATNFAICTVVLLYAIRTGAVDRQAGAMLSAYMTTQSVLFYVVLRSGLNLRFPDPSLTFPQIIVAITCVVGSYAILRDSRGASLMLLVMVLVFGMFNLTARQARFASLFALSLQGAAMWGLVHWQPGYFTPRQELIHFLFACTVLPTISLLSGQLSDLRERLRQRKDDLTLALERIQTLATRDELTGLYNRRHMMDVLVQQAKVADGGGRVFCVVLIDIDLFKSVNDMHGHGVGDEVLRHFAQLVQNAIGSSDYFARWGGEEFLLVLTDCRLAHAQACLQRIHRVINDASLSKSMPTLKVTFSAGVTERVCGEASEAVIERADRGLYRAKQTGRDKTYAVA